MERTRRVSVSWLLAIVSIGGAAPAHPGLDHDLERLNREVTASPESAELRLERARVLRLLGDFHGALDELAEATALAPHHLGLVLERAAALAAMGCAPEAEAELDHYVARGGDCWEAYSVRARLHAQSGQFERALADYSATIQRRPSVDLFLERGRILEMLNQPDWAAEAYREAMACLQAPVVIQLALIRVESSLGRHDAALSLIDEALINARVKTEWYLRRAEVLRAASRESEARKALELACAEAERALQRRRSTVNLDLKRRAEATLASLDGQARRNP